jgi:hypothetical protein
LSRVVALLSRIVALFSRRIAGAAFACTAGAVFSWVTGTFSR